MGGNYTIKTVSDLQETMRRLYYEKDIRRGKWKTYAWLIEEIGELSEALRQDDHERLREEIADVIAWLTSLANILGIDLEEAINEKYGGGVCPRCGRTPCQCVEEV